MIISYKKWLKNTKNKLQGFASAKKFVKKKENNWDKKLKGFKKIND